MSKVAQAEAVSEKTNYSSLFAQIEALNGPEKEKFCKTLQKEEKKAYIDYLKEKDMTMVSGVFKCFEPVGGSLEFSCAPYEGCEYKFSMKHGEEYTVPMCIAKHLETGCWWPTHAYIMDAKGQPILGTGKKNYRFSFSTGTNR